jgi:phosphomannomutase
MSELIVSISGVRGIVGESLNAEVALKWAHAYGTYVRSLNYGERVIAVGRDSRPSGEMLKGALVAGLLETGCDVADLGIVPTPTLQFYIREKSKEGVHGGVSITASHNPEQWNALKFFRSNGMYLDADGMEKLQRIISTGSFSIAHWNEVGKLRTDETAVQMHIEAILRLLQVDEIKRHKFKVAIDCVNGAGSVVAIPLLKELGCEVIQLNCDLTGEFARPPEPTPDSLDELSEVVRNEGADVGFGFDADADRVVIVLDGGIRCSEEMTLCVAVEHILSKKKGDVVTNISTTMAVDEIACKYGCNVIRTPVGDLNVSSKLLEVGGVVGGEGNGGVIYPPLQYARDGLLGMALVLEFMAERDKPLSELVRELPQYKIIKRRVEHKRLKSPEELKRCFECIACSADEVLNYDGLKLMWKSPKRWVHIRQSKTEDIIRIIAEAEDETIANELCDMAMKALLNSSGE